MAQFNNRFEGANYGAINQAGHDVNITTFGASSLEALVAAAELREVLGRLGLASEESRAACSELDDVERELRKSDPDRGKVASGLNRFAETLKSAGAFASAGAALFGPIGVIAGFLGPLGDTIVKSMRNN